MYKKYTSALPGQRFGRLVVTEIIGGRTRRCQCDCGHETIVERCNLTSGNTQSCGCLRAEVEKVASLKHGQTCRGEWSRAYTIYHGMRQRCLNPNNPRWLDYGGRGITICDRWLDSFESFLSDMGEPLDGHSLERVDNNGPYCKANCVWATNTEQARNNRSNRLLTFRGKSQSLAAWADELGISYFTLHSRLRRGWSDEETLSGSVNHVR